MYLGDFMEDATVKFFWNSFDSDGASITRATNGTVSVYKNGDTTQTTTGVTDTEDFDSLTGIHLVAIDLSADAFYAAGAEYAVILSAATIDGQTVNAVLAHFSIENRSLEAVKDDGTATFSRTTDSLQAIRDRGDAAWASEDGPDESDIWTYATRTITGGTVTDVDTDAITATSFEAGAIDSTAVDTTTNTAIANAAATAVWDEVLTAEPAGVFNWSSTRNTFGDLMKWLGALSRHKITQTATTQTLRNDADSGSIATSTVADDDTTATRGEWS